MLSGRFPPEAGPVTRGYACRGAGLAASGWAGFVPVAKYDKSTRWKTGELLGGKIPES